MCRKSDENEFIYEYKCYESCKDINISYYLEDTKECVSNCSQNNQNYYYIYNSNDMKCYKECPKKIII